MRHPLEFRCISEQMVARVAAKQTEVTTMTEKLALKFNLEPIYESVDDNPYLNDLNLVQLHPNEIYYS